MISPKNVMKKVEKVKANTPVNKEFDKIANKVLNATFPQSIVVSKKCIFLRNFKILTACLFPESASISRRKRVKPNSERLSPEKIPE